MDRQSKSETSPTLIPRISQKKEKTRIPMGRVFTSPGSRAGSGIKTHLYKAQPGQGWDPGWERLGATWLMENVPIRGWGCHWIRFEVPSHPNWILGRAKQPFQRKCSEGNAKMENNDLEI